ncbi:hypothetical protein AHF37_10897 [Paragonimus kellicotti]|nr:hypothetical protein AHF37_10897 [Paragonimus kellicotti]
MRSQESIPRWLVSEWMINPCEPICQLETPYNNFAKGPVLLKLSSVTLNNDLRLFLLTSLTSGNWFRVKQRFTQLPSNKGQGARGKLSKKNNKNNGRIQDQLSAKCTTLCG